MNYVLWPVFFVSIFYSLYDYHLWLNTDSYKEEDTDEDYPEESKEDNTDNKNEEEHPE